MGTIGKLLKRANEIAEEYQEVRNEEFGEQFDDKFPQSNMATEDELKEFLDFFDEHYPDEANWSWDKANAELDEVGDQKMELARDKEMGI